jgi:membrane protein
MTLMNGRSARQLDAARHWLANSLGGRGYRKMRETDLDLHALALCAQQVLCTAPLIVALGSVLQRETGKGAASFIVRFFGLYGQSAAAVDRLFTRTTHISTFELVFALATSVLFSTGVAAVQQRAFELIWTLPRIISVVGYLRQLSWAVALGAYSLLMLGLGRVGRELHESIGWLAITGASCVQGGVTFFFYWWSQRWLLGGRVRWRALFPGAIAVGLGTTVLFRLTRVFMPAEMAWPVRAYGLIGGVFVLSVWLMILCVVIFAGVLLGALLTERRAERAAAAHGTGTGTPLTVAGLESAAASSPPEAITAPSG